MPDDVPVMATVTCTYENDDKTYVATVTDANTDMSSAAAAVLNGNSVTNFVQRGDYTFGSGMLRVSHPCGFRLRLR